MSPYKITWVEFFPTTKSFVTKHDRRVFGEILVKGKKREITHKRCFSSKEKAIAYLENFKGKLDSCYKCLLFTDKQFGLATAESNYSIPYTKKQLSEAYYI